MTDKEIMYANPLEWKLMVAKNTGHTKVTYDELNELVETINRQQAEIERLQNESIGNCELAISMRNDNNLKGDCSYCIDKAKAEAIKEFAERLKLKVDIDLCEAIECSDYLYNLPKLIDNLIKEMVGEQE